MSLRVLLVDDDPARAALIEPALRAAGCAVVTAVGPCPDLLGKVRAVGPDMIVIDRDSPDRDTLEQLCVVTRDNPRPIVMFTQDADQGRMRAALEAGVSAYVVDGLAPERVQPIVNVALARFEQHQALRAELSEAKATLAERKLIERAKGIVMKSRGVGEAEAYQLLRKMAMDRNERLAQVADNVISMAKLLS
jgi:response regulator NasT